jgi:hypothetical protein
MATITIGSAGTTTLIGLAFDPSKSDADFASISTHILDDKNPGVLTGRVWPGAWSKRGVLYVPNRGYLQTLPGDIVAYDPATGWPILVSQHAAAGASWVHS